MISDTLGCIIGVVAEKIFEEKCRGYSIMDIPVEVYQKGMTEQYITLTRKKDDIRKERKRLIESYKQVRDKIRKLSSTEDVGFATYIFYESDLRKKWKRPWAEAVDIEAYSKTLMELGGEIAERTYEYVDLLNQLRDMTDDNRSII